MQIRHLPTGSRRGIYLREFHESRAPSEHRLHLKPVFHENTGAQDQIQYEMRLAMVSTQPWLSVGEHLYLTSEGQSVDIKIDPTHLLPGVHFGEILALDSKHKDRGPLTRFPVTIIRTHPHERHAEPRVERLKFQPGKIHRRFFTIPKGATWADLSVRVVGPTAESRKFMLHTVQLQNGLAYEAASHRNFLNLHGGQHSRHAIPVEPGRTLEVCIAQYWSSLGETELEWTLNFHGILPSTNQLTLSSMAPVAKVDVSTWLQAENFSPRLEFSTRQTVLTPKSAAIKLFSSARDQLPNEQALYELLLTYEFTQNKSESATFRCPWNDALLYDSPYGSQLAMLYDQGKRLVVTDDVFPESVKLSKGKYLFKLQFRHEDVSKLEELKTQAIILERPLTKAISLRSYSTRADAIRGKNSINVQLLSQDESRSLYIAAPSATQLANVPDDTSYLSGAMTFGQANELYPGKGQRPKGYPITYVFHRSPNSDSALTTSKSVSSLEEASWQAKLIFLQSLAKKETALQFEKLASSLMKEQPKNISLLIARLEFLDLMEHRKEHLNKVVDAADAVITQLNPNRLDLLYRSRINSEDAKAKREQTIYAKQRKQLVDALYRKGRALGYMELPEVLAKHPIQDPKAHNKAFEDNFAELSRWVDTTESEYVLLHIRRLRRLNRNGEALKLLNKEIAQSAPNYWLYKKRRDVFKDLGWNHAYERAARWLAIRFPKHHDVF